MKRHTTFTLLMAVCCLLLCPAISSAGSIETQSNPVANGAITVAPGDNNRSDWNPIPFYQSDPAGDAGPELDYTDVQVAHDDNNVYWMRTSFVIDPTYYFDYQGGVTGKNVLLQMSQQLSIHRIEATPL